MPNNDVIELAIEKLDKELKDTPQTKVLAEYLKSKCQSDLNLARNINSTEKTLRGLAGYITSEAKKKASDSVAMVDSNTVFRWAENYFGIDKPTINEDDVSAAAHAIKQGASTTIKENNLIKKPSIEHKKPKTTESDNQISLLDMMM